MTSRSCPTFARKQVQEIVQRLLDLHGTVFERVLDGIAATGPPGLELIDALATDDLVGSLLLLYGLHPQDLETRVRAALDKVRPLLHSHGGNVELLGITEGTVRLRLQGSCHGCPSSAMTLKLAIEEAIYNAAPDATALEVDGVVEPQAQPHSTFVPLALLQDGACQGHIGSSPSLAAGTMSRASLWPTATGREWRTPVSAANLPGPTAFLKLQGLARERPDVERCELCGATLAAEHQHLLEPAARRLSCTCDACAILFSDRQWSKYVRVPRRIQYLTEFQLSDAHWESLHLPINLAFFVYNSPTERVIALYPGPAGATESLLTLETWQDLVALNPILREFTPDVEALLVNHLGELREHFRVPIDECYRLVGLIRTNWRGLSGGTQVWAAIHGFLNSLRQRSRPGGAHVHA